MTSPLKALLLTMACAILPASVEAEPMPILSRESLPIDFLTAERLLRPFVNAFLSENAGYEIQTYLICVGARGGFWAGFSGDVCLPKDSPNLYWAYGGGEPIGSGVVLAKGSLFVVLRKSDLPTQPIEGDYSDLAVSAIWEWGGEINWIEKDDGSLIIGGGSIGVGINVYAGKSPKRFGALF